MFAVITGTGIVLGPPLVLSLPPGESEGSGLGWELSPGMWAFLEAGLEYSRHSVEGGDRLESLRWLIGLRVQTAREERPWEAYGTFGLVIADMDFDDRSDFVGFGPYAGVGVSLLIAERLRASLLSYAECTGSLLWDEDGQPGSCLAVGAGLEFRF